MMEVVNTTNYKYEMINHLHRVIKLILEIKGELYPMAVALDLNNKLRIDIDIDTADQPSSTEMVLRYDTKLNRMLNEQEILSYCIAVDTLTSKDHKNKETDTIVFMIKNESEKEFELTYYSYIINKMGKFEVIEIWENDGKQIELN